MNFGFTTVAGIMVICYLAAQAVKATKLNNKWIPIICGVLGGILGVIAMKVMPNYPASNYIDAAAMGIVSGLATTGTHQIVKQLTNGSGS